MVWHWFGVPASARTCGFDSHTLRLEPEIAMQSRFGADQNHVSLCETLVLVAL